MKQNPAGEVTEGLWLSGDQPFCPGLDFFLSHLLGVALQHGNEPRQSLAPLGQVRLEHQHHTL
jgi:hypothetical protein